MGQIFVIHLFLERVPSFWVRAEGREAFPLPTSLPLGSQESGICCPFPCLEGSTQTCGSSPGNKWRRDPSSIPSRLCLWFSVSLSFKAQLPAQGWGGDSSVLCPWLRRWPSQYPGWAVDSVACPFRLTWPRLPCGTPCLRCGGPRPAPQHPPVPGVHRGRLSRGVGGASQETAVTSRGHSPSHQETRPVTSLGMPCRSALGCGVRFSSQLSDSQCTQQQAVPRLGIC